jgi:hypothetical protein
MTTSFPSGLDALTNPTSSDGLNSPDHAGQHADLNDAVEALEAKVGVDGSAVTSSLDYMVAASKVVTDKVDPASASTNQVLKFNGTKFVPATGASVTVSDTPPTSPTPQAGDQWYESDSGRQLIYYDGFWVEIGSTATTNVNANDLSGTTLASNVVSSSLTSVGTLGSLNVGGASSLGEVLATTVLGSTNRGVGIKADPTDTQSILQFTNNVVSAQWSSIVATNGLLTATTPFKATQFLQGTDYLSPYQGFRNKIINGDMKVDQRNSASSAIIGTGYVTDRWYNENGCDAVLSAQQSTDVPTGQGFVKSLKVTATTADASIGSTQFTAITQHIEGHNFADLAWGSANAKQVVVSFWVKATVTGTYSLTLYNNGASRVIPTGFTVNVSNTWEKKTVVIAGDTSGTWLTDTGRGVSVNFFPALGSSYLGTSGVWGGPIFYGVTGQANAWASVNNVFAVTGVQLEQGGVATPFEHRSIGTELALCQRYYWRWVTTSGFSYHSMMQLRGGTPYALGGTLSFPTTMRSIPSISTSDMCCELPAGGSVALNNGAVTVLASTTSGGFYSTRTGNWVSDSVAILRANNTTSAYVEHSAEL